MNATTTIQAYQHQLKGLGYADTTIESYSKNLEYFRRYLTTVKINDLRQVTNQVMIGYKTAVMAEANRQETKALKLRAVKRLFEYLATGHRLLVNPTEGLVETCRKNRIIAPVLTQAEMQGLLEQPDTTDRVGLRNHAITQLLYSTGIRLQELLSLTLNDPDFREQTLYVRAGKGGKQRVVPLGKNGAFHLQVYLEQVRPLHSRQAREENALFITRTGSPIQPYVVRHFLGAYRRKAEINKPVSPHTLRRTCATHLLQQGADIRYIQALLGHSRPSITQAYIKVISKEVKVTHNQTHPGGTL